MSRVVLGVVTMLCFSAATWRQGGLRSVPRVGPFAQRLQPRVTQAVASLQIVLPQQKLPLGLGYINTTTNANRLVPTLSVAELSNADYYETRNGIAVMPDGTAWFTCQDGGSYLTPACLGHTVYLGGWSLFPGPNVTVLLGTPNAQGVGIMEAPAAQSGPFKIANSNPTICTIGGLKDHNFYITGLRTGTFVVTVTDAAATSATLHATVQAVAKMRSRHREIY